MVGANEQTHRLFVTVPLPQKLIAFATSAQELLPLVEDIRLVEREQMHCTLAFIGQADSQMIEAAMDVVGGATNVRLRAGGVWGRVGVSVRKRIAI